MPFITEEIWQHIPHEGDSIIVASWPVEQTTLTDKKSELKIRAIENGTVIDHITANKSLHILKILGLPDSETKNVTVAMNVS